MASLEEIRRARLAKLKLLRDKGINPYPVSAHPTCDFQTAALNFAKLSEKKEVTLAGRVMALRSQGGLVFADLFDGLGKFQTLLKRDETGEMFSLWSETVDIGDFVEMTGSLFLTNRREKTLKATSWRMLAKALRQLPEKWHGLSDIEERFRRRYLDLLMNEEVRARFALRSRMVSALREELTARGFLEVETSILQPLAGGANAEPFRTRHNALDADLYLRIAPELDLKKLLIGGFPKVYEVGRSFRNEGIDATHNPEFTTVEWYEAYSDAARQRALVECIVKALVARAVGKECVIFNGKAINFSKPFKEARYFEALREHVRIAQPGSASREELESVAAKLGVKVEAADGAEKILDGIYKKTVRPALVEPTFIVDYPKNYIPLAKSREGDSSLVDAFQLVIGGIEVVKAFSELNDPVEQRARFLREEENKKAGDKEAQPSDEEFIEALEYGMPPAGGVGLSVDRLTMLLSGVKNIREVIFFPSLRPKRE